MNDLKCNDSATDMIAQAFEEMKKIHGNDFSIDQVNLAELERMTGITRQRLRTLREHDFKDVPHGLTGNVTGASVMDGYTGIVDNLLQMGVTNSTVVMERLVEQGFPGSISTVKRYIFRHKYLVPAKRQLVAPQGSRGTRYHTTPGEAFQMDWGFVKVITPECEEFSVACFAMICHHCGMCYVEFFTNAKQENLFIGMIRGFMFMGIPRHILTDNMKSIIIKRDSAGRPIWQPDYESFMKAIGFGTKLCKPRHPFTKGKVERLIRFIKDNFLAGRTFTNISDLNRSALEWCSRQNNRYHREIDDIPVKLHNEACAAKLAVMEESPALLSYLCPLRTISFDGFVNYEGRRFGVPYWYGRKTVRVCRKDDTIYIYSDDLKQQLITHEVTWSRKDRYCDDQYVFSQPEELPSVPVHATLQLAESISDDMFDKFNFESEEDPS